MGLHVGEVEGLLVLLLRALAVGRGAEVTTRESTVSVVIECGRYGYFGVSLEVVVAIGTCERVASMQLIACPAVGYLCIVPLQREGDAIVVGALHDNLTLLFCIFLGGRHVSAEMRIFQSPRLRIVSPSIVFPIGIVVAVLRIVYLVHLLEQVVNRGGGILQIYLHTHARQVGDVRELLQLISDLCIVLQIECHAMRLAIGRGIGRLYGGVALGTHGDAEQEEEDGPQELRDVEVIILEEFACCGIASITTNGIGCIYNIAIGCDGGSQEVSRLYVVNVHHRMDICFLHCFII